MNCGDFRYLVQRRFDVELSPQDDRALLIHLETCDSCQKFYHQVQQVIIAAEELELSEDLLPQAPDHLFSKIWENIPQEKQGIGNIFSSLLELLDSFRKDKKENSTHDEGRLLPRISRISNRKQQGSSQVSDFGTGKGFGEQVSHPVTSWGQSSSGALLQNSTQQIDEEETISASSVAQSDQVATRSLGEKFGLPGTNPQLINKQGLSLAESIKQKISEMAKNSTEYQPTTQNPEPAVEMIDEWTVPHSPQWPKLSTDTTTDQWPNEAPGKRAPNAWGSTVSNWGGQDQLSAANNVSNYSAHDNDNGGQTDNLQAANETFSHALERPAEPIEQSIQQPVSDYNLAQNASSSGNSWSSEAEQLETGNWQMVEFDTTLGPVGYPSSKPISQPPPLDNSSSPPMSVQSPLPQLSPSPISNPSELTSQAPIAQTSMLSSPIPQVSEFSDFPLENFPQLFTGEAIPEEIPVPVVQSETLSEHAGEISQQPELQAPVEQMLPVQIEQVQQIPLQVPKISQRNLPALNKDKQALNNEKQNVQLQNPLTSSTRGPRIYPVVSKRAQATSLTVDKGFEVGPDIVKSPLPPSERQADINNILPQEASTIPIPQASTQISAPNPGLPDTAPLPKTSVSSAEPETLNDTAPLFKLDDGAIDRIFSNNLGVHESVVPTQNAQTESFADPAGQLPQTSQPPQSVDNAEVLMNQFTAPSNDDVPAPQAWITPNQSVASSMQPPASSSSTNNSANNDNAASSLFAVDDNLIDRIFTDALGVPEHISKNTVGTPIDNKSAAIKEEKAKPPALPIEPDFHQEFSPPPINSSPNVPSPPMSDLTNNIGALFGKSTPSSYSSGKQKISGVGKLDNRGEALADPGSGRIASIGKFLLDNKDLEKLGKITASDLSDSKTRTLTVEANEELMNLLRQIDAQEGVTGTVIVGHDGLLIANTMSPDLDPESLGVWALGVYMGTTHIVEKLGDDNVRQIVSQTNQGYLIIANFGAGLLVTLTSPIMLDKLLPLMRTITQLVAA